MQQYKIDFIQFALSCEVLKFGEFQLKSGRISPYFFNAGLFNSGKKIALLGEFYAQAIKDKELIFDVIFGPAYKGIPIATSTAIALANQFNMDKPCCFNRKEKKDHGEGGELIGAKLEGNILLVDDVITAGTAIRESMSLIAAHQAKLNAVLIAFNRQERGIDKLSAVQEVEMDYGCQVFSIIDFKDLLAFLQQSAQYHTFIPKMQAYYAQYGV